MNTYAAMLAIILWFVCAFSALAFFISRITSVKRDTATEIEIVNKRIDSFADSVYDMLRTITGRVEKLEESKICIIDTDPAEVGGTSLYAITQVGYSTVIVSLTEDEMAVIDSFIDWADLEEDFSAVKIDKNYKAADWRCKK